MKKTDIKYFICTISLWVVGAIVWCMVKLLS